MTISLTCAQVRALLPFYIDNKLSSYLKNFVENHLLICPKCMLKYESLKNMLKSLHDAHESVISDNLTTSNEEFEISEELKINLSAYVDNELDEIESIKIKKNIISNPHIRNSVEKIYSLKKILAKAFEKEKEAFKEDYSKSIFDNFDFKEEIYADDRFIKVFFILTSCTAMLMIISLAIFLH